MFDFNNRLIPADSTLQLSWRISDHLPAVVRISDRSVNAAEAAPR